MDEDMLQEEDEFMDDVDSLDLDLEE